MMRCERRSALPQCNRADRATGRRRRTRCFGNTTRGRDGAPVRPICRTKATPRLRAARASWACRGPGGRSRRRVARAGVGNQGTPARGKKTTLTAPCGAASGPAASRSSASTSATACATPAGGTRSASAATARVSPHDPAATKLAKLSTRRPQIRPPLRRARPAAQESVQRDLASVGPTDRPPQDHALAGPKCAASGT